VKIDKIGIALAAYRPNIAFLAEQLASIQGQSCGQWVCQVTFDSPMGEVLAEQRIRGFLQDSRFVFSENPERHGPRGNFQRAIQACLKDGAQAIACADQDDVWYPEKLADCVKRLEGCGPLSLVHSDMHVLGQAGIEVATVWAQEQRRVDLAATGHLLIRNVVTGCTMVMDAELARMYPVIPEGADFHDHWYALAASCHGGVHAIARPLMAYRQHGGNTVGVSTFPGVFWIPESAGWRTAVTACFRDWSNTHRLALTVASQAMPLSFGQRLVFLRRWDFGLGILAIGIKGHWQDRRLARASLKRAFGKFLWCLGYSGTSVKG